MVGRPFYFVPDVSDAELLGSLMVGAAEGLGGKLILTVAFFILNLFLLESSSSSGPKAIAVRRGGIGGGTAPEGFGSGGWPS